MNQKLCGSLALLEYFGRVTIHEIVPLTTRELPYRRPRDSRRQSHCLSINKCSLSSLDRNSPYSFQSIRIFRGTQRPKTVYVRHMTGRQMRVAALRDKINLELLLLNSSVWSRLLKCGRPDHSWARILNECQMYLPSVVESLDPWIHFSLYWNRIKYVYIILRQAEELCCCAISFSAKVD